jgi:ubiquinone biosynthesis protein COQ9
MNATLPLALVAMTVGAMQTAKAGSAIVWDGGSHLGTSYGHPVEIAKQRALESARRRGWVNVRIVAATDMVGYGAIAVALHPNGHGSLIGVSLGNRSAAEADKLAIEHCLQAGGTNPKIKTTFRG